MPKLTPETAKFGDVADWVTRDPDEDGTYSTLMYIAPSAPMWRLKTHADHGFKENVFAFVPREFEFAHLEVRSED